MSELRLTFFVSSTTQDLGSYREAVADALLIRGIYPEVQKYFAPDHRTVQEILHAKIAVRRGGLPGWARVRSGARAAGRPAAVVHANRVRHSPWLGKPIYLFLSADDCVPDQPPLEDEQNRALQQAFRRELESLELRWELFSRPDQLRVRVALLELPTTACRGRLPFCAAPAPCPGILHRPSV